MKQQAKFKQTEIGMIPEDWEIKKLGELFQIFAGGDLSKISFSKNKSKDYKYPIYSNSLNNKGLYGFSKTYQYEPECVTITARGDVGRAECRKEFFNAIVRLLVLKPKCNVSCYFVASFINSKLDFSHVGSAVNQLTAPAISDRIITIPSIQEQSSISKILSSLDSKIELNQQMNKTLEAIGQAIFKHWFVDFEFPNEKGKPYKSSGGEMVDSELGKIPKGWKIQRIKDCGLVVCGKTPPTKEKDNYGGYLFFITIPDMHNKFFVINTERKLSKKGADTQKKKELPPLTVCVSCIATPGLVVLTSEKSQTNQQINSVICNNKISPYFMYLMMKEKAEEIKSRGLGGTATLNLNTGDFGSIKIILPDNNVLTNFHKLINEMFQKILTNEYQIKNLSQIRDSLLPKLMSGKIRVPVEVKA